MNQAKKILRQFLTIFFLITLFISSAQTKPNAKKSLRTAKYAGVYSYGGKVETEGMGSITIYPETDSTLLFYIDLNKGAPSYNMGFLYGRVKIVRETATYASRQFAMGDTGCKWKMVFSNHSLIIKTINEEYECGFGFGVYADGEFKRKSKKCDEFFTDINGNKIYFKKTKPETYYKD